MTISGAGSSPYGLKPLGALFEFSANPTYTLNASYDYSISEEGHIQNISCYRGLFVNFYVWVPDNDIADDFNIYDSQYYKNFKYSDYHKYEAGVANVSVDDSEAAVEYFNLNGMRVNGENLTPGIYIRRQGTKAGKVLVR